MKNVAQIIEKYKSMSNEMLLDDIDQMMRDVQIIGQNLSKLDEADQYDAKSFLSGVLAHVDTMIADVAGQLNNKFDDIDKVQKMSEACLAYLKPHTGKKD